MANVSMAIDFGNLKLRVAVKCDDDIRVLTNAENYRSFPQVLIKTERKVIIGLEAEKNLTGYCNNFFNEFKYNILKKNGDAAEYKEMIVSVLKHFKGISEEYVKRNLNKNVEKIDTICLSIPFYDRFNDNLWRVLLKSCAEETGFKQDKVFFYNDEIAAIVFFNRNFNYNHQFSNAFCVFSLGSLYFSATIFDNEYKNYGIFPKLTRYEELRKSNGGRKFFSKLQKLFDQKLNEQLHEFLKDILKPEYHDFKEMVDYEKLFKNNKKYLAECYRKYQDVLEGFSGTMDSIQLEFRHYSRMTVVEPIEITRKEIDEALKDTLNEINIIIDQTKHFLKDKDAHSFNLLIVGNGFKFPGVKNLFEKEFPEVFHQRNVFYDEEIVQAILELTNKNK